MRTLFADQLENPGPDISNFRSGTDDDIRKRAREFRTPGVFDRDIGDLVMKVCATIIKLPIMVITSSHSIPHIPFIPENSICNDPIYVAYHYYGPGHYDATDKRIQDMQGYKN